MFFWLCFLFNNLKSWLWGIIIRGFSIFWKQGSNESWRLTSKECVKEEFSSDIGFWVEERFSVEVAFVEEIGTSDEEVVERRFLGREVPSKKVL